MNKAIILLFVAVFGLGFISASLTDTIAKFPLSWDSIARGIAPEHNSPGDHIENNQIHVYKDRIVLDIQNAVWSEFADTNSMDPLLDIGANGIEIRPKTANQISVGDVISYESEEIGGIVIHRVIEVSEDEEGWFAVVRGDNNPVNDPGKVRFEQVQGILVGVIY
ncbi:hypothetical protein ACFLZ7_01485 [Nanoarchaeota archaeon]